MVLAGGCLEAIDGIDVWIGQEHAEAVERRPHGMLCQLHQPELELLFALDDKLFTPSSYEQSRMRRESSPESERSRSLGCHVPMAFLDTKERATYLCFYLIVDAFLAAIVGVRELRRYAKRLVSESESDIGSDRRRRAEPRGL